MFFDSEVEIYYELLKNDQILSQCNHVSCSNFSLASLSIIANSQAKKSELQISTLDLTYYIKYSPFRAVTLL
jgi:hypothetical protein